MLYHITGTVTGSSGHTLFVTCGPLGCEIQVPEPSAFPSNQPTTLYLYLHWNQENGPSLFGFSSPAEKAVFCSIISCSGIGPKIGLAVLAHLGATGFVQAIEEGDIKLLSKVNGIGAKKAEQIIVQLKHKVSSLIEAGLIENHQSTTDWQTVTQALRALNYSSTEITRALTHLKNNKDGTVQPFDVLMRQALSFLAKQP